MHRSAYLAFSWTTASDDPAFPDIPTTSASLRSGQSGCSPTGLTATTNAPPGSLLHVSHDATSRPGAPALLTGATASTCSQLRLPPTRSDLRG